MGAENGQPNRDEQEFGESQLRYQHALEAALLAAARGEPVPVNQRHILWDLAGWLARNAASALS